MGELAPFFITMAGIFIAAIFIVIRGLKKPLEKSPKQEKTTEDGCNCGCIGCGEPEENDDNK